MPMQRPPLHRDDSLIQSYPFSAEGPLPLPRSQLLRRMRGLDGCERAYVSEDATAAGIYS